MNQYTIGMRYVALLLLIAMVLSFVPAISVFAATEDANADYDVGFRSAKDEGITLLNNGENTSLSIKINNFLNDGILFEYLQQNKHEFASPDEYMLEFVDGREGMSYVQLYPYVLRDDDDEGADAFMQPSGFSNRIDASGSLNLTAVEGDILPEYRDDAKDGKASDYTKGDTPFLRLRAVEGFSKGVNGGAWTKLTTFKNTVITNNIRYAVIVYRVPSGSYSVRQFALTINTSDGPKSQFVNIGETGNKWQYAIIDLMDGGNGEIKSTASIKSVYLHTPVDDAKNREGEIYRRMDIAAVGYFPYFGDAEQFGYYGISMGSIRKYLYAYNGVFSFHNPAFYDDDFADGTAAHKYDGEHIVLKDTIANVVNTANKNVVLDLSGSSEERTFSTTNSTADKIGFDLFGTTQSGSVMGLMQPYLENGRPVYKPEVVQYVAESLQLLLTKVEEYPTDNNGWRNYSFITGSSSNNNSSENLFGTVNGRPIDLGTAICQQLKVAKGSGTLSGSLGTYEASRAKADKLIGSWNSCKGNLATWMDVAYYLLHNLYVTDQDVADVNDGYGRYESDYQSLVMPQALVNGEKAYFFDSSYAYNLGYEEGHMIPDMIASMEAGKPLFKTALVFDRNQHFITMNTDADGRAMYCGNLVLFPFLPTSGNGTQTGETNSPYYMHGGNNRHPIGSTYEQRDYLYSMTGSGYFQYNYAEDLYFNFEGDDDVYLFINGQMVLDVGGCHRSVQYDMKLNDYVDWARALKADTAKYNALSEQEKTRVDALCLENGKLYDFSFFYMDRHGNGANLRIVTNIAMGLNVDKQAYQNGHEVMDKGLVDVNKPIEYSFSLNNDTDYKLYNLAFEDATIGVFLTPENGLVVQNPDRVTNAYGTKLMPNNLKITVEGVDENRTPLDPIAITCANNEELKQFLKNLASDDSTGTGTVDSLYAGDGLWNEATVTIRGIYYTLTDQQKEQTNFTNTVAVTAANKEGSIMTGSAMHAVHMTSNAVSYYQWVGKDDQGNDRSITITRDKLRADLLSFGYVDSEAELPAPGNMILIPSDMSGTEVVNTNISNTPGGNVYLEVCYTEPGAYMAYVTIRDSSDPSYSMIVPITIYAVGGKDSVFVLDYGLDTFLTEGGAIFDYELDSAVGAMGTVMGITNDTTDLGYEKFDANGDMLTTVGGNADNNLETITAGHYKLDTPVRLDHTKPWVIEWKGKTTGGGDMIFSMKNTASAEGNHYLYIRNLASGPKFVGIGTATYTSINGNPGNKLFTFAAASANPGVTGDPITDAFKATTVYQVRNVPSSNGKNVIKLYAGTDEKSMQWLGDLTTPYIGDTNWSNNISTEWDADVDKTLSGQDFEFAYMGTSDNTLDNTRYEYIRVYENGKQLTNYAWEMKNGALVNKDNGQAGYVNNVAEHLGGTINADGSLVLKTEGTVSRAVYWKLAEPLALNHDLPWQVSFTTQVKHATAVLHQNNSTNAGDMGLYLDPVTDMVTITVRQDSYTDYYGCVVTDVIKDFNMNSKAYTYTLKNRCNPDGSNAIVLYVDGMYAGTLESHYRKSGSALTIITPKSSALNGMDLYFGYIGHYNKDHGFRGESTLSAMSVCLNTGLSNVYEWVKQNNTPTSTNGTVTGGNQIVFESADANANGNIEISEDEGKFTLSTDGKLKFEISGFMDQAYTAYVALTIHESGFTATPLASNSIDISNEVQLYKKVTVLPASVVYYEDDFPVIYYAGDKVDSFTVLTDKKEYIHDGSSDGLTQSPDQDRPQGSDPTYSGNNSNISGNSLHTIAINSRGPLAWFNFKGTGFELSARTNAVDSGMMLVNVYKKGAATKADQTLDLTGATLVKSIPVISEFDQGTQTENGFVPDDGGNEVIYQVPLLRFDSGSDQVEDYVVVIEGMPLMDFSNGMSILPTYLYLDGIRIYHPLGAAQNQYGDENNAVYEEIRDLILNGVILSCDYADSGLIAGTGTTMWTEKFNNTTTTGKEYAGTTVNSVNDYLMEGPNNEVYLVGGTDIATGTSHKGSLAFYVKQKGSTEVTGTQLLHLGVRALDMGEYYGIAATGKRAKLWLGTMSSDGVGWTELATIISGTEQYINIPYELCPVTTALGDGETYYQVVIRVVQDGEIPAMISFSGIKKTNGLTLSAPQFETAEKDENGAWILKSSVNGFGVAQNLSIQLASDKLTTKNEVLAGGKFQNAVPENKPAIVPQYPSLSLEDEVIYNIYFSLQELNADALAEMGLITFTENLPNGTIHNAADVIRGYVAEDEMFKVCTNGIPAKNLGDTVYFKVYAKQANGTYIYSDLYSYSAVEYAKYQLSNDNASASLKALCVALMNYGAAAQEYFDYKTDSLMNSFLTAQQQTLVKDYSEISVGDLPTVDSAKVGAFTKKADSYKMLYPAVSLNGAFAIHFYFTPAHQVDDKVTFYYWSEAAYNSANVLTTSNATGTIEATGTGDFVAVLEGIAAKQIDETFYFTVVYESNGVSYPAGIMTYSLGKFCKNNAEKDTIGDLAQALAVYGHYAENHFA